MKKDFPYLVKSLREFFWLYTLIRPRKVNKMMLLRQFEKKIERLNKMSQKKIKLTFKNKNYLKISFL
jgi:hypothetical protein